jgi:DNA (cytosine-5)-methyltransferase 1
MLLAVDEFCRVDSNKIMRLLDLFCAAGGGAMGYHLAGFDEIVGVDKDSQEHYPFEFVQSEALSYLAEHAHEFDAVHASPPCQWVSQAVKIKNRVNITNQIPATRQALLETGLPYIIENIPRAIDHMISPVSLCGSAFGLPIRRHRLFESNVWLWGVQCSHKEYPRQYPPAWNRTGLLRVLSLSGGFTKGATTLQEHADALGITWEMTMRELSRVIPPAYTEHLGLQLVNHIRGEEIHRII